MQSSKQSNKEDKVAEIIKNADLYDLIRISMRSSNTKLSAVDRYIKRAIDRQQSSASVNDENSSIHPMSNEVSKYKINMFQVEKSEYTESHYADSPIKENVFKREKSLLSIDQKNLIQSHELTHRHSANKNPFRESQNYTFNHQSPPKSMKEESVNNSPLRQRQPAITIVDQFQESMLDECMPPSPNKLQPAPVRQTQDKPSYEIKIPEHYSTQEEDSSINRDDQKAEQEKEIDQKDLLKPEYISPSKTVRARYFNQTISSQNKKKGFGHCLPEEKESNSSSKKNFSSFNRSVSSNLVRTEEPTSYNLTSPSIPFKKIIRQCSATRGTDVTYKTFISPTPSKTCLQLEQKPINEDLKEDLFSHLKKTQQTITYDDLASKQVQRVAQQYLKKPQNNRQKLVAAFQTLNTNLFIEIERIKKPQKHALWTGRMLCLLVSILKEKPINDNFNSWESVVNFVNGNVTRFTNELLALQKKLLDQTYMHNIEKLQYLYNEYFAHTKIQTFKNHIANKNLRVIAHFVHTVLCYVLGREEEHFNEDISQIKDDKSQDNSSQNTFDNAVAQIGVTKAESKQALKCETSPLIKFAQTMTQIPQTTRNAIGLKGKQTQKKVTDISPFRLPKKNKFLQEPILEKHRQQQLLQTSVLRTRQKVKETTPIKDRPQSKLRCQTPVPAQTSHSKKPSKIEPQGIEQPKGRQSMAPVTQRASYKRDSTSFKASPLKKSVQGDKKESQVKKAATCQPSKKVSEQELVNIQVAQNEETKEEYQFSPNKVKSCFVRQNQDNLLVSAQMVEKNLKQTNAHKQDIDLSIIEDLKRRRGEQKRTPYELELKREQIIQQVQSQLFQQ